VYLSRVRQLKFPKKRYVLCVEGELENKKFKDEEYRYLELPLLVMLWSLTGHLPLSQLEDCFASGKVSVEGDIVSLPLKESEQDGLCDLLNIDDEIDLKIIAPEGHMITQRHYHLPLEGLLESLLDSAS
jgi:hypothetical protein